MINKGKDRTWEVVYEAVALVEHHGLGQHICDEALRRGRVRGIFFGGGYCCGCAFVVVYVVFVIFIEVVVTVTVTEVIIYDRTYAVRTYGTFTVSI